jgi:D-alanyl-D-alanine carboxypeptidase
MRRRSKESVPSGRRPVRAITQILLLGVLLALGLPAVAGATEPQNGISATEASVKAGMPSESARREAYRQAVLRVKEQFRVPGVVAGVWTPGKRPWKIAEGLGDVASGAPIRIGDYFPIRSVTKSYTGTLLLQLVRARAISLDDPVGQYVPDLGALGAVTLAQLAAMESGIKSYSDIPEFQAELQHPERPWTPRQLVDLALPYGLLWPPGSQYDYSNTNCILLGMVVERVTQEPLAQTYRKEIFRPLGLDKTSYPNDTDIPVPHPTPYLVDAATGELEECPVVNLSAFGASGGMVTTLGELHRWGRALGDGRLIGPRLQKTRLQHSRPATSGPEYDRYGLGIGQLRGWWGHTGEGLGYQAATFYDPRTGAVIAVILNSSQGTNVAAEVFKALADVVHPNGARVGADP